MAEITLRCIKEYGNQFIHMSPGDIYKTDTDRAEWILRDGPDCFEVVLPAPQKAVEAPPKDRMLRKVKTK